MTMRAPDFKRARLMSRLSVIAYLLDEVEIRRRVLELGLEFVALLTAPGFQALIVREADGGQIVAYRGTPVTCGRDIEDAVTALAIDAGLRHTVLPGGGRILTGVYDLMRAQWAPVLSHLDMTKPITFTGHSLGAVLALASLFFVSKLARVLVICFAPFQFADTAFWHKLLDGREMPLMFGRALDFAPGHDHLDPITCLAGPLCHLAGGGQWEWITSWPVYAESEPDHAVDAYDADVEALAEMAPA